MVEPNTLGRPKGLGVNTCPAHQEREREREREAGRERERERERQGERERERRERERGAGRERLDDRPGGQRATGTRGSAEGEETIGSRNWWCRLTVHSQEVC